MEKKKRNQINKKGKNAKNATRNTKKSTLTHLSALCACFQLGSILNPPPGHLFFWLLRSLGSWNLGCNLSSQKCDDSRCLGHLSRQHLSWWHLSRSFCTLFFFSTFCRHYISFEPKVFWTQNFIGHEKNLELKIILGIKIFLNKLCFCTSFSLTNPFWNFFEHSKLYLTPISFMPHFCGLNIFSTRFF